MEELNIITFMKQSKGIGMNLKKLKDPFKATEVEWRIGRCGEKNGTVWAMALCYITARAIHDRLDEVCGEAFWQNRYKEHLGETICEIGIKVGDEWIYKAGGGDKTDFEAFKGGLSSAEKRAGVPWGVGRYLYGLDETFVETSKIKQNQWNYQSANKKKNIPAFWWKTPILPYWALPKELSWLDQSNPRFNDARTAISKGDCTLEDVLRNYKVTKANQDVLTGKTPAIDDTGKLPIDNDYVEQL